MYTKKESEINGEVIQSHVKKKTKKKVNAAIKKLKKEHPKMNISRFGREFYESIYLDSFINDYLAK